MLQRTITFFICVFSILSINAQVTYTNFDDFKSAAQNGAPGDEIILASGRYEAESITISDVNGTADNPLIIRAEEIGKDTLDAGTYFDLRHCSYVIIQGFVINITDKSTTFKIQTCNHIHITQNIIDGVNEPATNDDGGQNSSVWISIQSLWSDETGLSHDNRIDYNVFKNKHTLGNMIRIDGTNEQFVSQYDVIEHNYFKNVGPRADNEMETIRIGWSAMSQSDGFCTVQNNLFEECNGDPEIISVKCNKNYIAHNTFRRCQGTLSLRHGNASVIEGNFFLGEYAEGTGGIRIYGSDHVIINNHFEGLTGTQWDAPITLTYGDADEGNTSLSKHFRIERAIIANNTLINNYHGIEVGFDNNGNYNKPPRDCKIAYNIIQGDTNTLVWYRNEPLNMQWTNNIAKPAGQAALTQNVTFSEDELTVQDPFLKFSETYQYSKATDATPIYQSVIEALDVAALDVDGQLREETTNYGADDYQTGDVFYQPLTPSMVGPNIGEYLNVSFVNLEVPVQGGEYALSVSSNINWEVSTENAWIELDNSNGSGYDNITFSVSENETGLVRTGEIVLTGVVDKEKTLTRTIQIVQLEKEPDFIEIEPLEFNVDASDQSITLQISSNTTWYINTDDDWINLGTTEGTGNQEVTVLIAQNQSVAQRTGQVEITDSLSIEHTITVNQDGKSISETKLTLVDAVASTEQTEEGNVALNLIDGSLDNRWSGQGDGAYVTLELAQECEISFIKVGLFKGNERHSYFDVQTSIDGTNFNEIISGHTTPITDELFETVDFENHHAKYVRIIGHGNSNNDWNSYTEFEVWGYNINAIDQQSVSISIFPNPASDVLCLNNSTAGTLIIYNYRGQVLEKIAVTESNYLYVNTMKPGVYLFKFLNNTSVLTQKVLIR